MATSMYTKTNNSVSAEADKVVVAGDHEMPVVESGGGHFHGHHQHGQRGSIGTQLLRYRVVAMVSLISHAHSSLAIVNSPFIAFFLFEVFVVLLLFCCFVFYINENFVFFYCCVGVN